MHQNSDYTKRVILFCHNSNLSGAPISLAHIAGKLPGYGFSPLVLIPRHGPIESLLKKLTVEYKILKSPGIIYKFLKIVKKEKPALIHVNTLVTSWPVLIAKLVKLPVIWHIHEYLGNKRLYAKLIHFLSTRVVLVSHEQLKLFRTLKKAVLVQNGIDPSVFENTKPINITNDNSENPVVVSFIGSIEPRKGLHILAKAASILASKPIKRNLHYVIVGEAPYKYIKYKEKIIKILEENNLLNRFHFLGQREDIPQILAGSDILCHPAFIEVFGMVIIEAMASRIPVISTRVGEIPWLIDNGITGYIVDPGDHNKIAEAIEKLATNENLRKQMGLKGFEKVKHNYTLGKQVKKISEIYREIINH